MKKRKTCQAHVESTDARCMKLALRGSRYCWWHQSKGMLFLSLVAGALLSLLASQLWQAIWPSAEEKQLRALRNDYAKSQKKPEFTFWVNGIELPAPTLVPHPGLSKTQSVVKAAVLIPTTNSTQKLSFRVLNIGQLSARDLKFSIQFRSSARNFVKTGSWEDVPELTSLSKGHITQIEHHKAYRSRSNNVIAQGEFYLCHDLVLEQEIGSSHILPLFLEATALQAIPHHLSLAIIFYKGTGSIIVKKL